MLRPHPPETTVLLGEQFGRRPSFHNPSAFEDHDHVVVYNGIEPVCDRDDRAGQKFGPEELENPILRGSVHCTCHLVDQEQFALAQQRARNSKKLGLSGRQPELAHLSLETTSRRRLQRARVHITFL